MNEEEIINIDDEDVILPDEDIPTSEEENNEEGLEDVKKTNETEEDPKQQEEAQSKALLNYLNAKGIKYNGENVTVENLDDLISTYQKGLNYDKVKNRADEEENTVMNYISNKARSMGISAEEYIKKVQEYEKEQEENKKEESVQRLMDRGIDEELARDIVETRAYAEQLKAEKAELEKEKEQQRKELEKEKEYEDFLKVYPEIKVEEIPKEVFEATKGGKSLLNAYIEYENKKLKEQIKQMEQNEKNASSSVVSSTSDGGGTEQQSKDAFLEGFDSVI